MSDGKIVPWSKLGSSGLKVSQYIIGCMQYGSKEWSSWVEDDEEKIFGILKKAYDYGIRTFDTADIYSNGRSEIILGKFLKEYNIKRDKVVIMTKYYGKIDDDYGPDLNSLRFNSLPESTKIDFVNSGGLSRKHIMDAVEGSMKRLGTYIDVYQIHRLDDTPPEEIMRGLNDVVEKGYVRYIGASSMKAIQFAELQHVADLKGYHKFVNMQSRYNLLEREDEHEMNYFCNKNGIGLTPYFALAYGRLARPLKKNDQDKTVREETMAAYFRPLTLEDKETPEFGADVEIVQRVEELAKKKQTKMSCIALAWLVSKGAHPIVGIGSEERLDDLVSAAEITLTDDEIKYLEEPYKPKLRM
uniref:Aldo-keto reductase n=1 Tax=Cyberlindnera americana TaxID=36016 RepID=A0A5P8N951_9ASCO|nr:aldo-keto reductase [Cyberlindnera americana]